MDNKCKITLKVLEQMYYISSPSDEESEMSLFIQNQLKAIGITDFEVDKYGAIYRLKPDTVLLNAHMDRVHDEAPGFVFMTDKFIWGEITGIGADDVNGCWGILKILELRPNVSFIFSVCEEGGKHNIADLLKKHSDVLKQMYCGITIDRRGSSDIICSKNDYGTDEFDSKVVAMLKDRGFASAYGLSSDCNKIKEYMSCCNLSCGYYNPHTAMEYTNLIELINTLSGVVNLIDAIDKRYEPKEVKVYIYKDYYPKDTYPRNYGYGDSDIVSSYLPFNGYKVVNDDAFVLMRRNSEKVSGLSHEDWIKKIIETYKATHKDSLTKYCEPFKYCENCGMVLGYTDYSIHGICNKCGGNIDIPRVIADKKKDDRQVVVNKLNKFKNKLRKLAYTYCNENGLSVQEIEKLEYCETCDMFLEYGASVEDQYYRIVPINVVGKDLVYRKVEVKFCLFCNEPINKKHEKLFNKYYSEITTYLSLPTSNAINETAPGYGYDYTGSD